MGEAGPALDRHVYIIPKVVQVEQSPNIFKAES
jgi:hypothetical protein